MAERVNKFSLGLAFYCSVVCMAESACRADERPDGNPIVVRVLVLNFDPIVPDQQKRLHEVCAWHSPRELADNYRKDVQEESDGLVRYSIVDWLELDEFPIKKDGFRYSIDSYFACRDGQSEFHQPDLADYERMLIDHGAVDAVNSDRVDEVWIFGGPYFGFHESAMAGPGAFYINGGIYDQIAVSKPIAVMGFNYERGIAEMLHNLCHRTESTMTKVYGGWKAEELNSNWARFAANLTQSGQAAVGSCHYPPNAESDYDYANLKVVESTAADWLNFPTLTGRTTQVSRETWGGPDYHRNYMKWWFRHLPKAPGRNVDGRLNNWWRYVFQFRNHMMKIR